MAWLGQPGTPQVKRRRVPPGMPAEFHTPFLRALGEPESAASQWRPYICDWAGAGHLPVLERSRRDTDPADAGPCGHEWHASPGSGEAPESPCCIHPPPAAGLGVASGEKTFGSSLGKRARNPNGFLLSMVSPTRRWRRMTYICVISDVFVFCLFSVSVAKMHLENAVILGHRARAVPTQNLVVPT